MIKVSHDPRSEVTLQELRAKQAVTRAYGEDVERATTAMDRLNEALKTIKLVDSQMGNAQDTIKKMVVKEGKMMADSIKALQRRITPETLVSMIAVHCSAAPSWNSRLPPIS